MEKLVALEFPLVGHKPVTVHCPPLIKGGPPVAAILNLATMLSDVSSAGNLLAGLSMYGTHYFEDIVNDLFTFCNEEEQKLCGQMEDLLSMVDAQHRQIVREAVLHWVDLRIGSENDMVEWINSDSCEELRKLSIKAAVILLQFLPLTSDGKLVLLEGKSDKAIGIARARAVENSEWGESLFSELYE
jgi:hypothetical protein